jgi:hypothetical protein
VVGAVLGLRREVPRAQCIATIGSFNSRGDVRRGLDAVELHDFENRVQRRCDLRRPWEGPCWERQSEGGHGKARAGNGNRNGRRKAKGDRKNAWPRCPFCGEPRHTSIAASARLSTDLPALTPAPALRPEVKGWGSKGARAPGAQDQGASDCAKAMCRAARKITRLRTAPRLRVAHAEDHAASHWTKAMCRAARKITRLRAEARVRVAQRGDHAAIRDPTARSFPRQSRSPCAAARELRFAYSHVRWGEERSRGDARLLHDAKRTSVRRAQCCISDAGIEICEELVEHEVVANQREARRECICERPPHVDVRTDRGKCRRARRIERAHRLEQPGKPIAATIRDE